MNTSPQDSLTSGTPGPAQRTNISLKLPAMVITLLLFAFTIYTFISIRITQGASANAVREELTADTNAKVELIRATLTGTRTIAMNLAAAAESAAYEEDEMLRLIENTLMRNEQVFGSAIAYEPFKFNRGQYYWSPYYSRTPSNTLQFTQLGNPEYDYFGWDWYTQPKERGEAILSAPYYDEGGGEIWMVTWSVPFHEANGDFQGVATADIAFSQTQEIINSIKIGDAGYAFLLASDGTVLGIGEAGGNYEVMVDSMLPASESRLAANWSDLMSEMLAGRTGLMEVTDANGTPLYVSYAPVGLDTGWSLALGYPREEILSQTTELQTSLVTYTFLIAIVFGVIVYYFTRSITNPLRQLTDVASQIASENPDNIKDQLSEPIKIETQDELEDLANAFNQMAFNLKHSLENLEEKVADRTKDLERIATELKTVSDVAREIAIIRDMDTLLNLSAELIRERLQYYHVGIFLVDERGEYAILRAASSVAAEKMLEVRYKLKVGETGLVGNVTRTGQAYIALDVGTDAVHFENAYLPATRSEIVLPLHNRSITFGALDIQATTSNAFDEQDVQTLQILADQLAAAIVNAQLVHQVESALAELSKVNRETSQQTWNSAISERRPPAYEYDGLQIRTIPKNLSQDLLKQLEDGQPIMVKKEANDGEGAKNTLLIPLMALHQFIGVIGLDQEDPNHTWTEEEIAIAQAAANRAALTLENARLLDESQRRASKERTIFEATTRIGAALSIENILQTTAEELERVLGSAEVVLQLNTEKNPSGKEK
jgi:GAF domain-containing protein/HAMP domain-containing protein